MHLFSSLVSRPLYFASETSRSRWTGKRIDEYMEVATSFRNVVVPSCRHRYIGRATWISLYAISSRRYIDVTTTDTPDARCRSTRSDCRKKEKEMIEGKEILLDCFDLPRSSVPDSSARLRVFFPSVRGQLYQRLADRERRRSSSKANFFPIS